MEAVHTKIGQEPSPAVELRASSGLRSGYLLLESLNSCAMSYYGYYIFFYLQKHFGFGNLGNLTFSAVNGFVYIFSAWYGGKFAQKFGLFRALTVGLSAVIAVLISGSAWQTISGQFIVMMLWTVGMCFTWPALEALISESGGRRGMLRMIGMYNVVWAASGALTYFFGGALFERFGEKSLFYFPAAVHCCQLVLLAALRRRKTLEEACMRLPDVADKISEAERLPIPEKTQHRSGTTGRAFLRMAWLANPFAYIAINTTVAVIPELARRLNLSPTFAGFFCSIWFFVRLATFVLLWQWTAWHYRFGWLLRAFIGLVSSFAIMLLVPDVSVLIIAQVVFGVSIGLIYYSSLFYSMDVGETKAEH